MYINTVIPHVHTVEVILTPMGLSSCTDSNTCSTLASTDTTILSTCRENKWLSHAYIPSSIHAIVQISFAVRVRKALSPYFLSEQSMSYHHHHGVALAAHLLISRPFPKNDSQFDIFKGFPFHIRDLHEAQVLAVTGTHNAQHQLIIEVMRCWKFKENV